MSQVFAGQMVGITQVGDKILLVSLMRYDLGFFDQEEGTVTSLDNPFGAKVLVISMGRRNTPANLRLGGMWYGTPIDDHARAAGRVLAAI